MDRRRGPNSLPAHALSPEEKAQMVAVATRAAYRNLAPEQLVAKLADAGEYLASESSFRRVLKAQRLASHRSRARPASGRRKPRAFAANGPVQVLTWDITYLRNARIKGGFFYLYMFIDIWSRRILRAEVHRSQESDLAASCLVKLCNEHDVEAEGFVLHSDNGSPMVGATMLATMDTLGITRSLSRPSVSDDNAFVESLFRHLKYSPGYPARGFDGLQHAQRWVSAFTRWYNEVHLHSSITYTTPNDRHAGRDIAVLEQRRSVYEEARQKHPRRWSRGTRAWKRKAIVTLNPDRLVTLAKARTKAA